VVEQAGLENRNAGNGIVGSNPTLSASFYRACPKGRGPVETGGLWDENPKKGFDGAGPAAAGSTGQGAAQQSGANPTFSVLFIQNTISPHSLEEKIMMSILYPEIMSCAQELTYGLMPAYCPQKNKFILIIKATKEMILTASINNFFKIYPIKDISDDTVYLGLVIGFFDDHDEPLTITTPLFSDDQMIADIKGLLSQETFDVYFFDENNFELLGASAKNKDFERFSKKMNDCSFFNLKDHNILENWDKINKIFSLRTQEDDINAYEIGLNDRLYPDDMMITDLRERFSGFNDRAESLAVTSLQRVDPGPMQEKDIARLLRRIFDREDIYVNPYRTDTNKELSDVLVVTDSVMLFVQAKDSPNTKDMLRRSLDRKHQTIRNHIQNAANQMRGALIYARDNKSVTILSNNQRVTIPLNSRQIAGLVLVKELFDDDYPACSAPVLKLVREIELPIGLLDYSQLHVLTQNLRTPARFINGLYDALDMALEHEQFPKSVWSGNQ
jgi:hypothetical protein